MGKLRMAGPTLRAIDMRTVKPAPKVADAELHTRDHRAWRDQVLANASYRCEAIEHGKRCDKHAPRDRLFADHIIERRDGGDPLDPRNGQCLCGKHHTLKTIRARQRRLGQ